VVSDMGILVGSGDISSVMTAKKATDFSSSARSDLMV